MSQTLLKKTIPTGVETESERFCGPQTEPGAGSSLAAPLVARLRRPQPRPAEVHLHTRGGASLAHPPWASGPTAGARGPSLQQCARGSRRRRWSEESTLGAALFSGVRFEKTFRCRLSRPRAGWGRTQISCSLLCCVGAIGGRATRTSSLGTRWDAGWGAARARTAPAPRHARSVRGGEQRRTEDAGRTAAGAEPGPQRDARARTWLRTRTCAIAAGLGASRTQARPEGPWSPSSLGPVRLMLCLSRCFSAGGLA